MKKNPRGRPPLENGHKARLPSVRISHEQLEGYQRAATNAGHTFADWIRAVLDRAAGKIKG